MTDPKTASKGGSVLVLLRDYEDRTEPEGVFAHVGALVRYVEATGGWDDRWYTGAPLDPLPDAVRSVGVEAT